MSSLAATKGDNFYYPPDFDPAKHKSLNKYHGTHALRERAKKIDQGILVIRFEVPFHIWCGKCGEMIAKGERFNAEKKAVGNYFSTKVWEFKMRHHCGCVICIHTDPKNAEYIITEGARKKVEEFSAAEIGLPEFPDEKEQQAKQDPFYQLEHGTQDRAKAVSHQNRVAQLKDLADARNQNPMLLNKQLRAQLRGAKKLDAALDIKRKALGLHDSVRLLPESAQDTKLAAIAMYERNSAAASGNHKRQRILSESIFGPSSQGDKGGPTQRQAAARPVGQTLAGKATKLAQKGQLGRT